jgi:selenocysteine-specific elongation factor
VTIGGGIVIDIAAPSRIRRTALDQRLSHLETSDRVSMLVGESKYGMDTATLVARTGLLASEIGARPGIVGLPEDWLVSQSWIDQKIAGLREILKQFHRKSPLQPGIAKEELRSRELAGAPPFLLDALLARTKDIAVDGDTVRLASHRVSLKEDEQEAVERIESVFRQAGLAVPSTPEVLAKSGVEPARARSLLQILLKNRKLIRVGDDLIYHATAIDQLRTLLAPRKGARFSVAEFKEWTGVSRKYAIPLLEFLDRERITRRDGDSRLVL